VEVRLAFEVEGTVGGDGMDGSTPDKQGREPPEVKGAAVRPSTQEDCGITIGYTQIRQRSGQ